MRAYLISDRISEHIARTPEGFLVCSNVVLCRTGQQKYLGHEIFGDGGSQSVTVHRSFDAVLDDRHVASLEGKPLVGPGHPPMFLSPQNVAAFQRGHVQNVRVGKLPSGDGCLIGDLVVTDPTLIDEILNRGLREVSTGYDCEYAARADGDLDQTNFIANHVALVSAGRANAGRAKEVRIMDGGNMIDWRDTGSLGDLSPAEAMMVLGQISAALSKSQPTATVDHGAEHRRWVSLGVSSEAQELRDAALRFHRRGIAMQDCRPALRGKADERREAMDAPPRKTPSEDAAEYAASCRSQHRK